MVGCTCDVCTSTNPKNQRYRCSVVIRAPQGNILIDTSPELRLQLLRVKIPFVHAVLFTHYHADHLFGLDDVRPMPRHLGGPVPLYCTTETERAIRRAFAYAFTEDSARLPAGFLPKLVFRTIEPMKPFEVLEEMVTPITLDHAYFTVMGFRIGDVAYCTDVNRIPPASMRLLEGLRVLILDALRFKPHPGHFCIDEAVEIAEMLQPEQTYLTHMSHEVEHEETNRRLPPRIQLAYDGLSFEF